MAVTNIHAITFNLAHCIEYIINPEKTKDGELVSSFNCAPESAAVSFALTREHIGCGFGKKSTTLAKHLWQSFSPEDSITPEQAHQMGIELAEKLLKGKYEYVLSTHVDHDHIHNHIIINNINFETGKTFETEENRGGRIAFKIQKISDEICREHNVSVIEKKSSTRKAKTHYEWECDKNGTSWTTTLKHCIDDTIRASSDNASTLSLTQ